MSPWSDEENLRRYDVVVDWCTKIGEGRRIERKDDGAVHIYWKDQKVADMVNFV